MREGICACSKECQTYIFKGVDGNQHSASSCVDVSLQEPLLQVIDNGRLVEIAQPCQIMGSRNTFRLLWPDLVCTDFHNLQKLNAEKSCPIAVWS